MAIWNGSLLCGLTIGKASRGILGGGRESNVTIHFLQGAPRAINVLKGYIAPISIDAAESYAKVLGKNYVYLKNPERQVMSMYASFGFTVAKRRAKGVYMCKEVGTA